MSSTSRPYILHVWPKLESALSFDPQCVAAILHAQLTIPGRFSLEYTTNPDESPSGQLPYLRHGPLVESGLRATQRFTQKLDGAITLDTDLTGVERAQNTARISHAESELGDLVGHYLFALRRNYYGHTRKVLASELSAPQRYYVPDRLRDSYKPRLEAAELWNVAEIEGDDGKPLSGFQRLAGKRQREQQQKAKYKTTYEREKVLNRARTVLDIYANMLGSKRFFYVHSNGPTSLDVIFAAHILLLNLPLSDPVFHTLLTERYPTLIDHANRILALAFPSPDSEPPIAQSNSHRLKPSSLLSLFPKSMFPGFGGKKPSHVPTAEERKFALMRWGFFGAAAVTMGLYMHWVGLFSVMAKVYAQTLEAIEAQEAALQEAEEDEGEAEDREGDEYEDVNEGGGEDEEDEAGLEPEE